MNLEACDTLNLYHIITHPLSILIQLQYQDRSGVSKNGIRGKLFDLRPKEYSVKSYDMHTLNWFTNIPMEEWKHVYVDHRGVPFHMHLRGHNLTGISFLFFSFFLLRVSYLYCDNSSD